MVKSQSRVCVVTGIHNPLLDLEYYEAAEWLTSIFMMQNLPLSTTYVLLHNTDC